jgi:response regulator RpfG family c-di-GMP phosphodiesterase
MPSPERPRILCVDDEPAVLDGLRRALRGTFDVSTAGGGAQGLEALRATPPFEVVMSDLRMPGMDGVALLERARTEAPDSVRILLTGQADLPAAVAAINTGAIFRFLCKPCAPEALHAALADAVKQHRLLTAERVLLERTLHGCVKALTDILALTHPEAFGRSMRAKRYVETFGRHFGRRDRWELEVAAMLSQIGCVTLPGPLVSKLYHGAPLSEDERRLVARTPDVARQLLADIPRLEGVREILASQATSFDVGGGPGALPSGIALPEGARLLRIVLDLDALEQRGLDRGEALATLRGRHGAYDPALLEALVEALGSDATAPKTVELAIASLRPGMVFAEDVVSRKGVLLIARGQEATASVLDRLQGYGPHVGVPGKVRVSTATMQEACA